MFRYPWQICVSKLCCDTTGGQTARRGQGGGGVRNVTCSHAVTSINLISGLEHPTRPRLLPVVPPIRAGYHTLCVAGMWISLYEYSEVWVTYTSPAAYRIFYQALKDRRGVFPPSFVVATGSEMTSQTNEAKLIRRWRGPLPRDPFTWQLDPGHGTPDLYMNTRGPGTSKFLSLVIVMVSYFAYFIDFLMQYVKKEHHAWSGEVKLCNIYKINVFFFISLTAKFKQRAVLSHIISS